MAKECDACKIMSTDDKRNFAIGNPNGGISDVMNFNDTEETKDWVRDLVTRIFKGTPPKSVYTDRVSRPIPGAGSGSLVDEPEIAL